MDKRIFYTNVALIRREPSPLPALWEILLDFFYIIHEAIIPWLFQRPGKLYVDN